MTILFEERSSASPYIETVTQGCSTAAGSPIRPAETQWHMVSTRYDGGTRLLVVGPWSTAGTVHYEAGAEIVWIRFRMGTYMPHRPTRTFLNLETTMPGATSRSFWLDDSVWQFPGFENAEDFVERLARAGILASDPLVVEALEGQTPDDFSPRTVRHRFLRAAGQTHSRIRQIERAKQAAERLNAGAAILDVVFELGYFDQPHLTHSLRQYIGHTPAQLIQLSRQVPEPA
jgi:hypothetical protein